MTVEEIEEFKKTIEQTIVPHALYMNQKQIHSIIEKVPEIDQKFKNMLYEQILVLKQESLNKKQK
ncbi:MAG: hypothetical protein ACNI3C_09895 [Candidatus Marinarcus sp.]|uniref:hypothetical protein n=1 Tax=Candidatus Marinarcus sp. TaxID=3100987 RepID=UPI003B00894C